MVAMPKSQAQALAQAAVERQSASNEVKRAQDLAALETGRPRTAGRRTLAATDQAELYLPFSTAGTLGLAAASTLTLTATVQRPIQIHRIIIAAFDNVTFADATNLLGVTGILIGVEPIFNANGVAPGAAFSAVAVSAKLLAFPAAVGQNVTLNMTRPTAITNASTVMAYAIGVSAG